jgi:hypothetical protein
MGQPGSYLMAHFDTANPLDDLVGFFEHFINDVLLQVNQGAEDDQATCG